MTDESTPPAANKEIVACLTLLNASMLAMNNSLQQFRSDIQMAEPATKRSITSDKGELSDQENDQQSDADKLLNQQGPKRRRTTDVGPTAEIESVVNNDRFYLCCWPTISGSGDDHARSHAQEEDLLLAEIAQAMDEGEKTAPNISDQLAKIITCSTSSIIQIYFVANYNLLFGKQVRNCTEL